MRTSALHLSALAAVLVAGAPSAASAQTVDGYWNGPDSGVVWKSGTGLCWRTGTWTPAKAIAACDPDLVPKPKPKPVAAPAVVPTPPPPPAPVAAPAPPPMPAARPAPGPAPIPKAITLQADQLFAFNKATLTDVAKSALDGQVVAKLSDMSHVQSILIEGFTDRLGPARYNQRLSERRAEAVRAYLVSRGLDGSKIVARGFGEARPVKDCPRMNNRKALIACLAPNRRVEIRIRGVSGR